MPALSAPAPSPTDQYPKAPPGCREYTGPMPVMATEFDDFGRSFGTLTIDLMAPSWVVLWAFRQVKLAGGKVTDPNERYREEGGNAIFEIQPRDN